VSILIREECKELGQLLLLLDLLSVIVIDRSGIAKLFCMVDLQSNSQAGLQHYCNRCAVVHYAPCAKCCSGRSCTQPLSLSSFKALPPKHACSRP
jgi:hypothetical protein